MPNTPPNASHHYHLPRFTLLVTTDECHVKPTHPYEVSTQKPILIANDSQDHTVSRDLIVPVRIDSCYSFGKLTWSRRRVRLHAYATVSLLIY